MAQRYNIKNELPNEKVSFSILHQQLNKITLKIIFLNDFFIVS